MSEGLDASDVLALTKNNGGDFGGSWAWIIIILLFLVGGNGFGFGGNGGRAATVEDVNTTSNFNRLENQVRSNENLLQNSVLDLSNGLCLLGNTVNEKFSQLRYDTTIGQKDLSAQLADCCCNTQKLIMEEGNKTRSLIQENKIESLQDRIHQLELANATAGIVRYPSNSTYTSGPNPYYGRR